MRPLAAPTSPESRDLALQHLASNSWDLLVIGGGISGVAVARDAALRGLDVALLEQHDLAFGTSSRSSRLIHGGLRYLANFELGLVREGLVERRHLLRTAAPLVQAERFLYLVYSGDPDSLRKIRLGVTFYGLLALGNRVGPSGRLSARQLAEQLPGLETDHLDGAISYHDGAAHDARLTVAVACSARDAGATLLTRCRVDELLTDGDTTHGARITDGVSKRPIEVTARTVVLCTGPWQRLHADIPPRIRTARGTHISVPAGRLEVPCFLALRSPRDGRQTFALPAAGYTVIGTTDDDDLSPPAEVRPTIDDTDYLLEVANHAFPGARLSREDVVGAWAGLRPLIAEPGRGDPDALSRRHRVVRVDPGRWILAGGKLTSHRRMAEDCVNRIVADGRFPDRRIDQCTTHRRPLFEGSMDQGELILRRFKAPPERIDDLKRLYGNRLNRLTEHLQAAPPFELRRRVVLAQATLAAAEESALTLDDVLLRRIEPGPLDLVRCWRMAPWIAMELAESLGWTREQMEAQVDQFRAGVKAELEAARGAIPIDSVR